MNVHLKLLSPEAFFSSKCIKYRLAAGFRPDPLGKLTALAQSDPLAVLRGAYFYARGGHGRGGSERERRGEWGEGGEERGGEARGGRSGKGRENMRHWL